MYRNCGEDIEYLSITSKAIYRPTKGNKETFINKIMVLYFLFYNAKKQSNCMGAPLSFVPAHEKSFVLSIVSI